MIMVSNNKRIPLLLFLLVCSSTILLLAPVVSAWVVIPDLQRAWSVAAMAAAFVTNAGPAVAAAPSMILADAADATTTVVVNNNNNFAGSYADPFHPNCRRVIATPVGGKVSVSGTDGNPGCPPDGSGRAWQLEGTVSGSTIVVDFSPKGGPANLKGTYVDSGAGRIQWPDGNSWTKK